MMYLCNRYPKPRAVGFRIPPLHSDPKFRIPFRNGWGKPIGKTRPVMFPIWSDVSNMCGKFLENQVEISGHRS